MFSSKDNKDKVPRAKSEKFSLRANGIGVYHAAPAVCIVAMSLALSTVISGNYPATVSVFASSMSVGFNSACDGEAKTAECITDCSAEIVSGPFLPENIVRQEEATKDGACDLLKYCSYVSSEQAEKKLAETAEKERRTAEEKKRADAEKKKRADTEKKKRADAEKKKCAAVVEKKCAAVETEKKRIRREHEEAWGQKVTSSNKNLYLDNYSYQRGSLGQFSSQSAPVRLNTRGVPMSQLKVPASLKLDSNGVPTNYSYYIDGKATAYCDGTLTATGTKVRQGAVAVDPRIIPYGTEMYITSLDGRYVYGYCRAEDTGGFIYFRHGATVDLFMQSYSDCDTWGFRDARIYILPPSY